MASDLHNPTEPEPFNGVPRTASERAGLLASRPGGWEYMLFAGDLLAQRDRLEAKWHDEELGLPGGTRTNLAEDSQAIRHAQSELSDIQITIRAFNRLFTPEVHERAFGAPGAPGDPARIEHLAKRIMNSYEELLDWAADLRACAVPEQFETLFELLPQLASQSIRALHDFVDEVAAETARIPALLDGPPAEEPVRIELTVVLDIDEKISEAVHAELQKLSGE